MPRPIRVHLTEAIYYVTCKAAEGFQLFKDSADYETYGGFLKSYQQQFGFELFAHCLLPNEVHLLIKLNNDTTVSEIMHALNSRYTKHIIKRYEHMGHVFQERFRSTLIENTPSTLSELTAYVQQLDQTGTRYRDGKPVPGTGFKESVFNYWRAELAHPVVGSEDFHRLVQEKARQLKEAKAAEFVQAPSSPAPVMRAVLPIFAGSVAVALLSLGIVLGALKHQSHLQQTVQMLGRQVQSSVSQIAGTTNPDNRTLASYTVAAQLAGTSWDIQIAAANGIGAKPVQEDELHFDSGKVISEFLSKQGFAATNYSLTLQPDGTSIWETMVTAQSGEIICWQGEVAGNRMRGMMTRQLPGQETLNFSFVGVAKPMQEASVETVRQG